MIATAIAPMKEPEDTQHDLIVLSPRSNDVFSAALRIAAHVIVGCGGGGVL
jgi:hypothetical protein